MSESIAQLQTIDVFFQDLPSRLNIIKSEFEHTNDNAISIRVHRNHVFETFEDVLKKYLAFSKINARFEYSDYDDSFLFQDTSTKHDFHIIWIDLSRYSFTADEKKTWIKERISALRNTTDKPILLVALDLDTQGFDTHIPNVLVADISAIEKSLGDRFIDERRKDITGGRLSDKANILIAREIAFKYISSCYNNIKAIVVDLDNTLYSGVLGEDGVTGVTLTEGHISFQKKLKELKDKGVFISILSKNKEEDAKELFNKRKDFILKWDDFTTTHINWNSKGENMLKTIEQLRVGQDTILFFDDNIGELLEVSRHTPHVKLFPAHNTDILANVLDLYPGLYKSKILKEDLIRNQDLKANQERESILQNATSQEEYFKQLDMHVDFFVNPTDQMDRIVDMSNKTNQFNLAFRRYNKANVEAMFHDRDYSIVTFSLRDALADSGVIGVLFGQKQGDTLVIRELAVSCRALGRNIENLMIHKSIQLMINQLKNITEVTFDYQEAPRNAPATDFLKKFLKKDIPLSPEAKTISVPFSSLDIPTEENLTIHIHQGNT